MRLFAKLFLCATFFISIALLVSGYLLITTSHQSVISREIERALTQYQFDKFTVQANLIANGDIIADGMPHDFLSRFATDLNGLVAFFSSDGTLLYSELPQQADITILDYVTETTHAYQLQKSNDDHFIMVGGKITHNNQSLYLLVATDISDAVSQRDIMVQSFVNVYFMTLLFSIVLILLLSALMTRPIKRMSKAAASIAQGNYSERLPITSGDEIGDLSKSYNIMADAIEDKIIELSESVRQKEDFVANFAHELKTPLTSVIGYADMLYQKNLLPNQVKDAAWYILSEGLRLEALSLKLMDLIVLNKQEFVLEEMRFDEIMSNIEGSLKPVLDEKKAILIQDIHPAYVLVEFDLFKTLLLNLIDNALKAGGSIIKISGKTENERYVVCVSDNGRGIPESDQERITEAFYMVDKSRARKQHGAGLGLTLSARIAEIHGSALEINSIEEIGTTVEFSLRTLVM